MVCEKILGKLNSFDVAGKTVDYVDIDWDDAFKKIHRKTTAQGREIGIRMDDSVLTHGLTEGDVLYADDRLVIAVHTPPCEMIRLTIAPDHRTQIAKACYEIGNRHAPLFAGDNDLTFLTPYNKPMLHMLSHIHGVSAEKVVLTPDFEKRISSGGHSHGHHH